MNSHLISIDTPLLSLSAYHSTPLVSAGEGWSVDEGEKRQHGGRMKEERERRDCSEEEEERSVFILVSWLFVNLVVLRGRKTILKKPKHE